MVPEAVQLSVAVGSVQAAVPEQEPVELETIMFAGQPLIMGFWRSVTVTVKVQVAVLAGIALSETA